MTVLLRRSTDLPAPGAYGAWLAVTGTAPVLDRARKLPGLAKRLEDAFVAERDTWWRLGRALSAEPGADVAHMPTAGSFGSDFGVMLAWARLVGELAGADAPTLVVCDDPWLFRHLAGLENVDAGRAPGLFLAALRLWVRGFLARCLGAARNALAAVLLGVGRRAMTRGGPVILVYGHPDSDARGHDAYFGDLMAAVPALGRVLHTDCRVGRARDLCADGRTAALHAWGSPIFALRLVFCRWRPGDPHLSVAYGWLIRRASALENGGGGPAMNRWQMHCQERFLDAVKPDRVLWPWENHGWERNMCRATRARGIAAIGYQHTVIGPHQFNYATATNHDGLESIPDAVVADGPAYRGEMAAWGVPDARLLTGGAFRLPRFAEGLFDADGPVFVALAAIPEAARAQIDVARSLAGRGKRVLVKPHPMYAVDVATDGNLEVTDMSLATQRGLAAVLYCTGTSGLEAVLMGVPAYRLMLDDRIAIDVLPDGIDVRTVLPEDAADRILEPQTGPAPVRWDDVLCDPDMELWKRLVLDDMDTLVPGANETKKAS